MMTRGAATMKMRSSDWTVNASDKSNGALFEHSFALLPGGKPFVLTDIDAGAADVGRHGVEISN